MDRTLRNSEKGNRDLEAAQLPSLFDLGILPGPTLLTKEGTSAVRDALRELNRNHPGLYIPEGTAGNCEIGDHS